MRNYAQTACMVPYEIPEIILVLTIESRNLKMKLCFRLILFCWFIGAFIFGNAMPDVMRVDLSGRSKITLKKIEKSPHWFFKFPTGFSSFFLEPLTKFYQLSFPYKSTADALDNIMLASKLLSFHAKRTSYTGKMCVYYKSLSIPSLSLIEINKLVELWERVEAYKSEVDSELLMCETNFAAKYKLPIKVDIEKKNLVGELKSFGTRDFSLAKRIKNIFNPLFKRLLKERHNNNLYHLDMSKADTVQEVYYGIFNSLKLFTDNKYVCVYVLLQKSINVKKLMKIISLNKIQENYVWSIPHFSNSNLLICDNFAQKVRLAREQEREKMRLREKEQREAG